MIHNPYTPQVHDLEADIAELESTMITQSENLTWHESFDEGTAKRLLAKDRNKEKTYTIKIDEVGSEMKLLQSEVRQSTKDSKLGLNPTRWPLAADRLAAKQKLARQKTQLKTLKSRKSDYISHRDDTRKNISIGEGSLLRYSSCNSLAMASEIDRIAGELESTRKEFDRVKAQEAKLDEVIRKPLEKLKEVEIKIRENEDRLAKASKLNHKLSTANNSYERKLIHQESESAFGEGKPDRVARRAENANSSLRRTKEKLERRIESLIRRQSQEIRSLIIDGSNLCYEQDRLIGLFALRTLCENLPSDIEVTVVFDGSILKKLDLPTKAMLRKQMSGVSINIVDDLQGADETILDAAETSTTFVLSGDRFAEYPEKKVIKEDRVIPVQIINGRVIVHWFGINVDYNSK